MVAHYFTLKKNIPYVLNVMMYTCHFRHIVSFPYFQRNCNCNCNLFAVHTSKIGYNPVDIDIVVHTI